MKELLLLSLFYICTSEVAYVQNFTSYFTGNSTDTITNSSGGICLMGGASEHDNAMIWFLQQANGGDILVLRASGSNGYNDYLFSDLGVDVNSVETIVFNNSSASDETYIHQRIQTAEAIWFAGGDQWDYISFWRNTAIDSLINDGINNRNLVVGGTSAGMAIQGEYYFSAQNGTVTSASALSNPYNNNVTVDSTSFLENEYLQNTITDTHFDDPDRKGRLTVFLSRILMDYGVEGKAIACDEYTAVCIDTSGIAHVFGDYPSYDENIYFIQLNCELANKLPEDCSEGNPLDWNRYNQALKVYSIKGTNDGSKWFDLNDWQTGYGGDWEHWYVDEGVFYETSGTEPDCSLIGINDQQENHSIRVYPNPTIDFLYIESIENISSIEILNSLGQLVKTYEVKGSIYVGDLPEGVYYVKIQNALEKRQELIIIQ